MTANEIRASFLKYFEANGHRIVPSSPLVPGDDPTLLFTNAGMNQFKDVFLGRETRDYTRATTSQKVMRVSGKHNDLDNVGPSHRHHTFFEMLGNFSFGDYFKDDALPFAWKLLTEVWKLPADKLVVSIFKGENGIPRDDEAYGIWRKLGVPADRILEYGGDDNFWQMGDTGPCGRCSEIYFVRSGTGADPEIEIWNNVFMEFERSADGTLTPLPARSIDTGMGFERITSVLQKKESNYDTDLFAPLLERIGQMAGEVYGASRVQAWDLSDTRSLEERAKETNISMRVVADHIRATAFLIADGVQPSHEWRGYVLRKIMRRAMRHGRHLHLNDPFLFRLVEVLDQEMGEAYPELRASRATIEKTILEEEKRFQAVLSDGLPRLEAEIAKSLETPTRVLSGDVAFRLYDTFGLPRDFIEDTAATQGVTVDKAAFDAAMEAQRGKGRAGSAFKGTEQGIVWMLMPGNFDVRLAAVGDQFEGYGATTVSGATVVALWDENGTLVDHIESGIVGYAALSKTPFYREAGGQVSDSGRLYGASGNEAVVEGILRVQSVWPRFHRIRVTRGSIRRDEIVTAEVDAETRDATRRNHTATHLLHAALREVLGTHVKQAGSLVAPDRLRFDFMHVQPVSRDEQERIERIVNEHICRNTRVTTEVRSTQEAIASGAMALFGEKYGDQVRVVSVPGFSLELCGGTHVSATGDIGFFVIVEEGGVAAGVRRIEALTGAGAVAWAQHQRAALAAVLGTLHVPADHAVVAIERLRSETKRLARENTKLKSELALAGLKSAANASESADSPSLRGLRSALEGIADVGGVKLARRKVADFGKDALRGLADSLKAKIGSGVVVIASENDGKVQIVVSVTPDLTGRLKAGQIVKEIAPIVGGAGGGRPDFAEAGGRQPDRIDEMLKASEAVIGRLLG
jgi:alanyl-tRNA synthetase